MGLHLTGSSVTQLNNAFAASLTATAVKTGAYTAAAGDLIPVDATSGAVTITLPTAPADRTRVAVKKIDASTNAVTVSRGGSSDVFNKSGGFTTLTLTLTNQALSLQYSGGIWYVVGDDLPLGQLDTRFAPRYYAARAINPISHGAVLTGAADDTAAFQATVDEASTSGAPIEIVGRLRQDSNVVLPVGVPITIRGAARDVNSAGSVSNGKAQVESGGASVFTAASASQVILTLENINFRNTNGSTTALFDTINFTTSHFEKLTTGGYNYVFKGGGLSGVSRAIANNFMGVKTVFCSGGDTDTFWSKNYINGAKTLFNPTCFTGNLSHSTFEGNYIDFFKRVLDLPNGQMTDIRLIGNVFDYCWNVIGTSGTAFLSSFVVVGNSIDHCTSAAALSQFGAPDADMSGTPWRFLDASSGINRSTFTGNKFIATDLAFRLRGHVTSFREVGNEYDSSTQAARIDYQASYGASDSDVYIESIERGPITPTFAASQTVDWSTGGIAKVTLTATMTNLAFSNPGPNFLYELHLIQDATGSRTLSASNAKIKWAGGTVPTLSTGASKRDIFRFRYDMANDVYHEYSRSMNVG